MKLSCHSVAINPSEVLHQSGVTMVDGTLGPLTATEARAFNDVVGEFGASDGGRLPVLHRLRGIMIHAVMGFLWQRMRLFLLHE